MPTLTPDQLDAATVDLIFALRDSLTDAGPDLIDFWNERAATAIETAAAGADTAPQALSIACRKLQIEGIKPGAVDTAKRATDVMGEDFQAWVAHVSKTMPYIVMLARLDRDNRKKPAKKKTTNAPEMPKTKHNANEQEIPF